MCVSSPFLTAVIATAAALLGGCVGSQTVVSHTQRYKDGRTVSLPPLPASSDDKTACEAWRLSLMTIQRDTIAPLAPGKAGEFFRPELMAIGDSLFNGVQSLRINWFLAEWSPPALVAIRLGLIQEQGADRTGERMFYEPQYRTGELSPRMITNYGFDLEGLPGLLGTPGTLVRDTNALQDLAFTDQPPNRRPLVDNIAYLSSTSYDLLYWTPADYRAVARRSIEAIRSGIQGVGSFPNLVEAANAAFVLNPTRNLCLEHLTPIQQVELRKPRRLLVGIGHNDGMWSLAFTNRPITEPACSNTSLGENGEPSCSIRPVKDALVFDFISNVQLMLQRLSAVEGLEAVYVNTLPRPSRTANLVPFQIGRKWHWYSDLMSGPGNGPGDLSEKVYSSDQQIADSDDLIVQVNRRLADLVRAASRPDGTKFYLVDADARLGEFDAKRCDISTPPGTLRETCRSQHGLSLTKARFGGGEDVSLDNRPIRFEGESGFRTGLGFQTKIVEGGLFAFDNMHLSAAGYEIMADTIVRVMRDQAHDHAVLPAFGSNGEDLCPDKFVASNPPPFGACAALLTTPGWSYEDATRKDYSFLRTAGLQETNRRELLSARINFIGHLLHLFPANKIVSPEMLQRAARVP